MRKKSKKYGVTTDEIMDYLKENVPTHDDLKQFATKEDLKQFATKEDLGRMRSDIIDFVDKKLLDLKGDIIILMKTEDQKLLALIALLVQKNVISDREAKQVVKIDPFRQAHVYAKA
ncbi:hypothetical protein HYV71_00380 [Candidatus Uhrbacteria bacterium]|nr:hypothetical protein [Candidatus Uhrbacteria bacterium]